MVPVIDEISQQDFLKKPFQLWVWIVLLIFLIYFTISLKVILNSDLFLCFFESLACSLGSIQRGINNKYLYIQMFLFGFIIWNLYSSKLSSYLTTPNFGKLMKTVEEIQEANITLWADFYRNRQINIIDYMRIFYQKIYNYEQITFKGQFNYSIEKDVFYKHLYKFNSSLGYLINEIKWNFISHSQKLLVIVFIF